MPAELMESIEWTLLCPPLPSPSSTTTSSTSPASLILSGSYLSLLTDSELGHTFFSPDLSPPQQHSTTHSKLQSLLDTFLSSTSSTSTPLSDALCIGVAALLAFCQGSFTGPPLDTHQLSVLNCVDGEDGERVRGELSLDGEDVYALTPHPILLLLAIVVFEDERVSKLKTTAWWRLRARVIHQHLLDNHSATLQDSIMTDITTLSSTLSSTPGLHRDIHVRFELEQGLVHHYYHQDQPAKACFEKAQRTSRLEWSLTGALGKRTKFQTFDVSQLVVVAKSYTGGESTKEEEDVQDGHKPRCMPDTLDLNNDVLLEKIQLTDSPSSHTTDTPLRPLDQCILLAFCLNLKNSNPTDGLTAEQMRPFVTRVLDDPRNWMVHSMGLLLRSRLEKGGSKTVERAVLQLQALVDQFPLTESSPAERMQYFFSLALPPKFELEKELGEGLASLGAIRSAMDMFTRLNLWEDVVHCHVMLEEPKKAETLVTQLLQTSPKSPKLHCMLGDIRKEPMYYEMAWELSGGRFSRAMRSLGVHYWKEEKYDKCIECYHRALAINPLFENSWFIMGCAALRIQDWDIAIKAFNRVVTMDRDNGEAWTNLASVFIKQKKKREAWRAIREALRSKYDASNIWENYLYVSVDVHEYAEAMRAMERVLEIRLDRVTDKKRLVDIEILSILIQAVTHPLAPSTLTSTSEAEDESLQARLVAKLSALLDTIHSKVASPEIFTESAKFYESQGLFRKALEFRLKAYRALLHSPSLQNDRGVFEQLGQTTLDLVEAFERLGPLSEPERMTGESVPVCSDWSYQSTTCLKTVVGRTRKTFEDTSLFETMLSKWEALKGK